MNIKRRAFRSKASGLLESLNELRATIRIAAVIQRINPDKDVIAIQHFRPSQRKAEKDRVPGWHISDGNIVGHLRIGSIFWNVNVRRQRAAAELAKIDLDRPMLPHVVVCRDPFSRDELMPMPLAIVKAHRIQRREPVLFGNGQTGRAIQPATAKDDG